MACLLLVDDSAFNRRLVKKMLSGQGHVFCEAGNVDEAQSQIDLYDPDCILLDLMMPGGNGLDLLATLQGTARSVIVITADIQDETHNQCRALGARSVLTKPVNATSLNVALDDVLTGVSPS
jgi:CheY-like chemotaxis protein